MKFKNLFLFVILSVPVLIYSQEPEGMVAKRKLWFYNQRSYPYDTIPENAYANAVRQKDSLRNLNGYYLNIPDRWISIGPNIDNTSANTYRRMHA